MKRIIYRLLALFFGLMSLGGISEAYRIMTAPDIDIASQRTQLSLMALILLAMFLFLTRFFWRESKL